jgi:hypothetical protein
VTLGAIMDEEAFIQFGRAIDTNPWDILLAKWRRDRYIAGLLQYPAVKGVIESGSLARRTTIGAIHDIDLVVILDRTWKPQSSAAAGSPAAALDGMKAMLDGTGLARETETRNHVVRCHSDVPPVYQEFFGGLLPSAPPVEVMPAYRDGPNLLIPNTSLRVPQRRTNRWVTVNPERLIGLVEERQHEWRYFKPAIHLVKSWAKQENLGLKSAVIEALVLKFMPRKGFFQALSFEAAMAQFFKNADRGHIDWFTSLNMPAGVKMQLGLIQAMNVRAAFRRAAENAGKAVTADADPTEARSSLHYWRQVFGPSFGSGSESSQTVVRLPLPEVHDEVEAKDSQVDLHTKFFEPPLRRAESKVAGESWLTWLVQVFSRLRTQHRTQADVAGPGDGVPSVSLTPSTVAGPATSTPGPPDGRQPSEPFTPTSGGGPRPSEGTDVPREQRFGRISALMDSIGRLRQQRPPSGPQVFGR